MGEDYRSMWRDLELELETHDVLLAFWEKPTGTYIRRRKTPGGNEPPRDCRRLHSVRGWGHETAKQIFTGGT